MTKKKDQAPPKEGAMEDLCQAMNEFRTEISDLRTELKGKIVSLHSKLNARLDQAKDERIKIKEEATLIRGDLLELASHADFAELDNKIAHAANEAKATRLDLRNMKGEILLLKSTLRNAGMSVK